MLTECLTLFQAQAGGVAAVSSSLRTMAGVKSDILVQDPVASR